MSMDYIVGKNEDGYCELPIIPEEVVAQMNDGGSDLVIIDFMIEEDESYEE